MHFVYLIKSISKSWHYIRCTDNLSDRLKQHNKGRVRSTKSHAPFHLVYYEAYAVKSVARKREVELKSNSQQKEILYKRLGIL